MSESHDNQTHLSNSRFKSINIHGKIKMFDVGNYVIVRLCPKYFHKGTFGNLQARDIECFEVSSRVGKHRFVTNIPDWGICYTFSIKYSMYYKNLLTFSSKA